MTIKQKAIAYDKAIKRAKELISRCIDRRDKRTIVYRIDDIEEIFPELKESEDERIRKGLLHHLRELQEWKVGNMSPIKLSETYNVWIAWLEKQKKCSEEDEKKK